MTEKELYNEYQKSDCKSFTDFLINKIGKLKADNEQWEKRNETLKDALEYARKIYGDELEKSYKEIAELKEKWLQATDEGYARTLQTMQLSKAKDLLAKWVELFKPKLEGYPITPIQEQTEQFLNSEVEKCGQ